MNKPSSSTSDLAPIYDGLLLLASHFEDGSEYSGSYPEVTLLRDAAFTIEQIMPIPVSERLPEVGESALFYFPGMMKIWTEDGTDPFIADPKDVKGDAGQWLMLTLHADGWLRCHGTQLKLSDATHYLPLPPKPE